jgi:hypothetical protein|tara:strand:+ start:415 stop:1221 length:807 start_codon:yes stop_codon:yes gene_type:complete
MKTFCISIYNQKHSFFIKNNLTPVGLGNEFFDKEWINDKFKNDISAKNLNFGEYSFHYRLWKDDLLKQTEYEWIGFCTYRRFWINKESLPPKNMSELSHSILKEPPSEWNNYDCILAEPVVLGKQKFMKLLKNNFTYIFKKPSLLINKCTIKDHFYLNHGNYFLDEAIKLLDRDEQSKFNNYLNSYEFNPHNLFICKNIVLLNTFYNKIFNWLFKCEEIFKNFDLDTYGKKRIYGFLAERYLPFWFKENSKTLNWPYAYFDTNKINND